jgi:hypothetical protein
MLSGPYMVINQLIKSIWNDAHLKHMLGGKKYQSNKKWPKLGLLKIKPKCGHSKVCGYLLIKIFVLIFSIHIYFSIMYHIFIPYKNYWNEIIRKNAFEC